jgi:hypothetical protein
LAGCASRALQRCQPSQPTGARWGLGLGIHGLVIFLSLQGDGLRQRMIEREMERLRQYR